MFNSQVYPTGELHSLGKNKITHLLLQMGEKTALKRKTCVSKG